MLAIERRHHILNHLQENRRVLVADLAQEFSVSEETVRRDLDKLEQTMQEIKILKNRMRILNETLDIIFEYDYINE